MSPSDLALAAPALPLVAAAGYLAVLTGVARRHRPADPDVRRLRWVIVVPAHNEADGIGATLDSLALIAYPAGQVRVVVVADNCIDDTAAIARAHGAFVVERHAPGRRGKGYALSHAFSLLLDTPPVPWDAVLVVDADSDVSANILSTCSGMIRDGAEVVQALYLPRVSAHPTAREAVQQLALTAFHDVRSRGRARLGLSAGLRGNGMAFTRGILRRVPHHAHSQVEDIEHGLALGLAGVPVAFAADAVVRGEMPAHARADDTQGQRWIGGRVRLLRAWSVPLARAWWRTGSPIVLDLWLDLLLPPLSVLAAATAAGLAIATVAAITGLVGAWAVVPWVLAATGVTWHVADAMARSRIAMSPVRLAASVARHVTARLRHALRALFVPTTAWHRTPRATEHR